MGRRDKTGGGRAAPGELEGRPWGAEPEGWDSRQLWAVRAGQVFFFFFKEGVPASRMRGRSGTQGRGRVSEERDMDDPGPSEEAQR